ncbi:anaerobic ribonucleoside-triphosphate reductase activating protein [Halomonas sp. NO4]|uniref:anaerobic ribonucleoside-triphosphate reductase activating protein n=1 Tax=Halomonas sp. NO4 TaxID=2484813 RepID=UPI0013D3C29F|nr:anaerobic ribonucleoside-triphosphate reductase activating protein [Halomonas sp. NO4]
MNAVLRLVDATAAAIRLPVAGLAADSDTAFPGRRAAVVFLQGCPLACNYCDSGPMAEARRASPGEWEAIHTFLEARRGEIDAVVFSGGEPTLHPELVAAADACRELGLAVGLHTAGPYPERLERLLPRLDWVALDTKGRGRDFDRIAGRERVWQHHVRSLGLLLDGDTPYECRTTVHWRDFDLESLERLALTLADCGVRRYAIQLARTAQCRHPDYRQAVPDAPSRESVEVLVRRLKPYFESLELRG